MTVSAPGRYVFSGVTFSRARSFAKTRLRRSPLLRSSILLMILRSLSQGIHRKTRASTVFRRLPWLAELVHHILIPELLRLSTKPFWTKR